ncbi:MAG TPA: GLPGLI family protein, partial [Chitinophagaceae bacterium]
MKKIIIPALLLMGSVSNAQMKEGKVVYERTIQMNRIQDPEIAARVPRERKENFELMFGNNQSLWQVIPNADGTDNNTISGPGFMMRMAGSNDITYINFEKGQRVDQREMFDREFLVEDSITKLNWKLTGETNTILNYPVQKAVAERVGSRMVMSMENGEMKRQQVADTSYIIAWFSSNIPVP